MNTPHPLVQRSASSGSGYQGISSVQRKFANLLLQRISTRIPEEVEQTRLGLTLLHSPPEPAVDFVFVHGLRGGAFKTWRKYDDPSYLWPKTWISLDSDLSRVRTSTYGYQSDWADKRDSILTVHDFGRSLLNDLITSPFLRRSSNTPIVLIGHSMGGLVIKKAYLLARQESREIATRIKFMFFFATPHRGSDSAALLKKLLAPTTLDRPYVTDLQRHSASLQVINDEFRNYVDEIGLWSFYETLKSNFGVKSEIVVDKDSAVLGYKGEESQGLIADHRGAVKFESPEDPNYVIVRNALVAVVEDLLHGLGEFRENDSWRELKSAQSYLQVFEAPESDLEQQLELKTANTCGWIENRINFRRWFSGCIPEPGARPSIRSSSAQYNEALRRVPGSCHIYWLSGGPGTGKSVCAAHVVTYLRRLGFDVSFFFFKFGVKSKNMLSVMLRSLAYQMATLHADIRQTLFKMHEAGQNFEKDDEAAVWRKVFANGILKIRLERPQCWVIDALDECVMNEKLFPLLSKLELTFDLRIFLTSRLTPGLERAFGRLKIPVIEDRVEHSDTQTDMRAYLKSEEENLPVNDAVDRAFLVEKLLAKSSGCFLWLRLVRQELDTIYSDDSISDVLDEIPAEMSELYNRSLESMSHNSRERRLIQALLTWSVCSIRPLNLSELQIALKFDDALQVRDVRRSIQGLCNNILYVDSSDRVTLIHSTARDFLLDKSLDSPFAVDREAGHERLAKACFSFIAQEIRPPRSRSVGSNATGRKAERSPFADYACTAVSEHVSASSSTSDSLLAALASFLDYNVLAWIEYVASEKRDLYTLTRAAKNFKRLLERRVKHVSPLGLDFQTIENWSTDLIRLVAKFGRNLINYPGSIFFLIPAIAPPQSRLHAQSLNSPRWLDVVGLGSSDWDDCVSVIEFRDSWATAIAAGDTNFAVGLKNGTILVYDQVTCQQISSMHHRSGSGASAADSTVSKRPNPIKLLVFDNSGPYLASASPQSLCIWNTAGTLLQFFPIQEPCVTMCFQNDRQDFIAVSRAGHVLRFDLTADSNALAPPSTKIRRLSAGSIQTNVAVMPRQAPIAAAISPDQSMLALLYRGRPIYLWSMEDDTLIGLCGRDVGSESTNISVQTALFNPDPHSRLLAVAYQDGELALHDAWTQKELHSVDGNAYTLAATADGRTLGTGDTRGKIQLWDFETLTLMYCITSGLDEVRGLVFSNDGTRLMDIRGSRTKVWEPSALVRKAMDEEASVSEAVTLSPTTVGTEDDVIDITAMVRDESGDFIFAGRSDGVVVAFECETGRVQSELYKHTGGLFVTTITHTSCFLASADAGGRVVVHAVTSDEHKTLHARQIFNQKIPDAVQQLLINPEGDTLMISTTSEDMIWSLTRKIAVGRLVWCRGSETSSYRWASVGGERLALYAGNTMHLFNWKTIEECASIPLRRKAHSKIGPDDEVLQDFSMDEANKYMICSFSRSAMPRSTSSLEVWINPGPETTVPKALPPALSVLSLPNKHIEMFLGLSQDRIVFIDKDLWICSIDLTEIRGSLFTDIKRHFFISPDFVGNQNAARPLVTRSGSVVFPKEDQLTIIKGGLEWTYG